MTAIAGIARDGEVWIGGDSMVSSTSSIYMRADEKVFFRQGILFGYAGSVRIGQLIKNRLQVPPHLVDKGDEEYLVVDLVDAIRETLRAGGVMETVSGVDSLNGDMVIGYRGKVYEMDGDFQIGLPLGGLAASGCGAREVKASLLSTEEWWDQEARIRKALDVASQLALGVGPPFLIRRLSDGVA